ncbi:MAG: circularly permuted type 2 ATP-grasp protein [Myxococcota bacterium]|nr:circularly permuted type 2 ATP-grasp protein [Myxococcota bacterium]
MGYDEIYASNGTVRDPYRGVVSVLEKQTIAQMDNFRKRSLADFHGDNILIPVPRMLGKSEIHQLRTGVQQRAKAIRAFLSDYYSGTKSYQSGNVIPESLLQKIIKRSNESGIEKWTDGSNMGFWYGPDIIRGPNGDFRIIEDNPGHVGGMGDLKKAKKIMFQYIPELKKVINTPNPEKFYKALVDNYQQRCKGGSDKVVLLRYDNSVVADQEDSRMQKIFGRLGVETVMVRDNLDDQRFRNSLVVRSDGVYLKTKGKTQEKVGFVIADMEPNDIDPTHPSIYASNLKRQVLELIEDNDDTVEGISKSNGSKKEISSIKSQNRLLRKLLVETKDGKIDAGKIEAYFATNNPEILESLREGGISGLLGEFYKGNVGINNAPGSDFIGDKEFYIYVEKMIEFYLGEKPIIKNLPTRTFRTFSKTGKEVLDQTLFNKVFDETTQNKASYVIKRVDGRGGKSVWVGAKMDSWDSFAALKDIIVKEPDSFIVQQYTPLSQVDGHLVDLRLLSDVNSINTVVAPVPWGRAVLAKGSNGKVNISDNGGEQVVMVADPDLAQPQPKRRRIVGPTMASTRSRRPGIYDSFAPFKLRHIGE